MLSFGASTRSTWKRPRRPPSGGATDLEARLTFDRRDDRTLWLDGDMAGHRIRMSLRLFDHTKLLLLNRGFNWIEEYPFNR
jgi:hypothetical protein